MAPPKTQLKEEKQMTPSEVQNNLPLEAFKPLKRQRFKLDQLLLGGAVVAAIGLAIAQLQVAPSNHQGIDPSQFCQEIVQPKAVVTREQLAKLLTISERDQRAKVQGIVKQPYCKLPSLSIRAGATVERDLYPFASDAQTWLVIAYEGDTYVGYGFKRN